jgi:hypothetical protein
MILFIRTLSTKLGKYQHAVEMAKKVAVLIKTKYNVSCNLYVQSAGFSPAGSIYWALNFDSYSHYEKTLIELDKDEDYLKAVENISEYFVSGTIQDSFLEKISIEE